MNPLIHKLNCRLVKMTTATTTDIEYFHVCKNEFGVDPFDIGEFIDGLCNYFHDLDIINFGKFRIPVAMVSSVAEFLQQTIPSLKEFECVVLSEAFFLFKARQLYFHITWSIVDGCLEFAIIHGSDYYLQDDEAYVFHDDDDSDTVVA